MQDTIEKPQKRLSVSVSRAQDTLNSKEGMYISNEYANIVHDEIESIKRKLVQIDTAFLRDDLAAVDYPSHRRDHLDRRRSQTLITDYKVSGTKVIIGIMITFVLGLIASGLLARLGESIK